MTIAIDPGETLGGFLGSPQRLPLAAVLKAIKGRQRIGGPGSQGR